MPPRLGMNCVGCEKPIINLSDRQVAGDEYWHKNCREKWNAKEIQRLQIQCQRRQDIIVKLIESIKQTAEHNKYEGRRYEE